MKKKRGRANRFIWREGDLQIIPPQQEVADEHRMRAAPNRTSDSRDPRLPVVRQLGWEQDQAEVEGGFPLGRLFATHTAAATCAPTPTPTRCCRCCC